MYLIEVKLKSKKNKSHIGFSSENYKESLWKYDFILNKNKMNKANVRELKQDFKSLIKNLKRRNWSVYL